MNEICGPYSFEIDFYKENNIPLWECEVHGIKDLGIIYKDDSDDSYIKAIVNPWPAQFWTFEVGCGENQGMKIYKIKTGSGGLYNHFPIMKMIADGMLEIEILTPERDEN